LSPYFDVFLQRRIRAGYGRRHPIAGPIYLTGYEPPAVLSRAEDGVDQTGTGTYVEYPPSIRIQVMQSVYVVQSSGNGGDQIIGGQVPVT
jgi:hypothetical protein